MGAQLIQNLANSRKGNLFDGSEMIEQQRNIRGIGQSAELIDMGFLPRSLEDFFLFLVIIR